MNAPAAQTLAEYLRSIGREVHCYGNASHAFKEILGFLNARDRRRMPNVIMPSFIPAKLYRTVLAAGYEPRFYDIFGACRFDPQQVEDLIDANTTAVFVIHYFGLPADLHSLVDICRRRAVSLIEDCAHVLLGTCGGKPLGGFGDFAIFSVRKMLQLSDGGFLVINLPSDGFRPSYDGRVRSVYTSTHYVLSRAKRVYLRATGGRDLLHLVRPTRIGALDPGRKVELRVRRMSRATQMLERVEDIHTNSKIRRVNYLTLTEALKDFPFLRPLYEGIPSTWTPYSLPMIVDRSKRALLQAELLRNGVSCGLGWPESPFDHRSTRTRELADGLIEFPINPLILDRQFHKMADACRSFQKKYTTP